MSSEFRVVRKSKLTQDGDLVTWLEIMDVSIPYRLDGQVRIHLMGVSKEDLAKCLREYATALDKPILEERKDKLVEE